MTRARLLEAAAAVFARRGFAGASLEDVAEEAGLTKGAVYSNFESKDDLITTLLYERLDKSSEEIASLVAHEGSVENQAIQGADLFIRGIGQDREAILLGIEFAVYLARNPELVARFSQGYWELRANMAREMEERAKQGGLSLPLPADALAAGLFALGQGIALARLSDPDGVPEDLFAKMLGLIFGGSSTRETLEDVTAPDSPRS